MNSRMVNRRTAIGAVLATLGPLCSTKVFADSQQVPLADAHSHLGLIQKNLRQIGFNEQVKELTVASIVNIETALLFQLAT
jgi:hypothetical protein